MEVIIIFLVGLIPTLLTLWLNERVKGSVKSFFDAKLEDIKKEHSKEIEELKKENTKEIEEVKKEHSKEISKFQLELNHLKSKENFKFTKLHEKRFEVLQKTYQYVNENIGFLSRLVSLYKELPDDISEEENEKKLRLNFDNSYNEFQNYYNVNLIFFNEEIELLLKKYFEVSRIINVKYFIAQEINAQYSNEFLVDVKSFSIDATKIITYELIPIKKQIEVKFRELLGE